MREVWLALYGTATGIFRFFPGWAVCNREFENWIEAENEIEAKRWIRNTYSPEALFLMGLDDLTEMRMNYLYMLPSNTIGTFKETQKEVIEK